MHVMTTAVQGAQSFSRSIAVLQLIADDGPATRADVARRSGLTRPTVYRIIASLEAEGLVVNDGGDRFGLGGRLVSLARAALAQNDVRRVAEPFLTNLRDATGETVHLAIRSGDEMVYIDKIESRAAVRMASEVGTRVPFHSTGVGKAYLSAMAPGAAADVLDRIDLPAITPLTTTNRDALNAIVRRAREGGYVRDDQENEIGIVCFGAPIRSAPDDPVASVSISIPTFRIEDNAKYAPALVRAANAISRRLGYDAAK